MRTAALAILVAAACYLIGLGFVALLDRRRAFSFLRRFAQTPTANMIEMTGRLLSGLAMLRLSGELPTPPLFRAFGALLAVSAIVLLALPGFHRRFADRVMPAIERGLSWVGLVSILLGSGLVVLLAPLTAAPPTPY